MITVIAAAGTSLKLVEMSLTHSENTANSGEQDSAAGAIRRFLDAVPATSGPQAAIAEGRDIAAIVATLELPEKILAATTVYPLVRDKLVDIKTLENKEFSDFSRIVLGLVQLGQFALPADWQPGEALAIQQSEALRKMLLAVGEDNVLWGTDSIWYGPTQPAIDALRAFQIPKAMREQYGYPELTPAIKAKILGLNAARVYGIDAELTRERTRNDDMAWIRAALDEFDKSGTPQ